MGVVGAAIKGFGKALTKGKKAKLKTVYSVKPWVNPSSFKKSKKHGLAKKLDVWANRQTGKILSQAGHGVNIKYTKAGKPFLPKGTKSSILTRGKGAVKLVSPIAAGLTVSAIRDKGKQEKKKK